MDSKQRQRQKRRKAKQRRQMLGTRRKAAASAEVKAGDQPLKMPSPFASEQAMRSFFGPGPAKEDPEYQAQMLVYDAWETDNIPERLSFLAKAVRIDPGCVDALTMLAGYGSESEEQLIESLTEAMKAGEARLGIGFFKDNRGHFWGILETRPYMRARAMLAQALWEASREDETVAHYESMLELNPNDNQGLRYPLLGCYLAMSRTEDARNLLKQYEDECSAFFAWGSVLERYLSDDLPGAKKELKEAREGNSRAEAYLTGKKRMPRELPEYYGLGDENEAIVCAKEIGRAWKRHPEAVKWLRSMAQ